MPHIEFGVEMYLWTPVHTSHTVRKEHKRISWNTLTGSLRESESVPKHSQVSFRDSESALWQLANHMGLVQQYLGRLQQPSDPEYEKAGLENGVKENSDCNKSLWKYETKLRQIGD